MSDDDSESIGSESVDASFGGKSFRPYPPGEGPECPGCGAEITSMDEAGVKTLVAGPTPGYDEDGNFHRHDPNWMTRNGSCENGHRVTIKTQPGCPSCDYGGETKIEMAEDPPDGFDSWSEYRSGQDLFLDDVSQNPDRHDGVSESIND